MENIGSTFPTPISSSAAQSASLHFPFLQTEPNPFMDAFGDVCFPGGIDLFAHTSSNVAQSMAFGSPPLQTEPASPIGNTDEFVDGLFSQDIDLFDPTSSSATQLIQTESTSPMENTDALYFDEHLKPRKRIIEILKACLREGNKDLNSKLAVLNAWMLPRFHITSSTNRETDGGIWMEKRDGFKAFRDEQTSQYYSLAERTWEFHLKDATPVQKKRKNKDPADSSGTGTTKTDWVMQEYCLLEPHSRRNELFLVEDFVVRRIFNKNEKAATIEASSGSSNEEASSGKRPRTSAPDGKSDVWNHFIKINTKNTKVVYALCPVCSKGFKAPSGNGTSNLKRHKEKCGHPSTPAVCSESNPLLTHGPGLMV